MDEDSDILNYLSSNGLEVISRFYSHYRGVVVSNDDDLNMNRIQVIVPQFDAGATLWAYPLNQEGSFKSGFKGITPKPGQVVWISFEFGDPLYPIWSYHGWAQNECPDELANVNTIGLVTPSGHSITLSDDSGIFKISLKDSGNNEKTSFIINNDGEILLNGNNEGLPISSKLVTKLNNLEKKLNSLLTVFSNWAPTGNVTDASTLKTALTSDASLLVKLDITEQADIESTINKQGI